ncbi:MAG: hypothetical protein HON76_07985 [Candidatus Scalindua sp.]|jgi:hypothetical protein|nr:hypothetical protein [Candidatus Scalindua sp.]MBT6052311.1 hypothetical protein [Candidatus Scalindua sp.]MBT6229737.1 hypothetical protein [Candidatus Scalindua sp.]MBT6562451.1 hypothetical protein [Candidatus Scalindua sp.]MBT7210279.1 hypothetical protein [Candidatus Scalindua sp.]
MKRFLTISLFVLYLLGLSGIYNECMPEDSEAEKQALPVHFARMHKLHDDKGLQCKTCHRAEERYPEDALTVAQYSSAELPGPGYVDKTICLYCHRENGEDSSDIAPAFYGEE